jgi:hypothetical protein
MLRQLSVFGVGRIRDYDGYGRLYVQWIACPGGNAINGMADDTCSVRRYSIAFLGVRVATSMY